ncbi:MAG: hypothetical protein ABSC06_29345 [Rhodopila sp.]|jgi:hypothetical protein
MKVFDFDLLARDRHSDYFGSEVTPCFGAHEAKRVNCHAGR